MTQMITTGGGGLPQGLEQQIGKILSGEATIEVVAKDPDPPTFMEKVLDHGLEAVAAILVAVVVAYFTNKWRKRGK
jgi:hypothetical protein